MHRRLRRHVLDAGGAQMTFRPLSSMMIRGSVFFIFFCGGLPAAQEPQIPVVDGGLGSCRADFTVKDGSDKPLYNAKVHVTIKYGFFDKRKTDLEVGTNSDGKASVTGLPNAPKKPIEFTIKSGTVSKDLTMDPSEKCVAKFDVTLTVH
jgi:hypothetical protein